MEGKFKVWITIEEVDDEGDHVTDHDPGGASEAQFDTVEEAQAYVDKMRFLVQEIDLD